LERWLEVLREEEFETLDDLAGLLPVSRAWRCEGRPPLPHHLCPRRATAKLATAGEWTLSIQVHRQESRSPRRYVNTTKLLAVVRRKPPITAHFQRKGRGMVAVTVPIATTKTVRGKRSAKKISKVRSTSGGG